MDSPSLRNSAKNIPSITELRQQLQYGTKHSSFTADNNSFRKSYHTSTGIQGVDLYIWSSEQHQAGLEEMTDAYLDTQGKGDFYWPDNKESANFNTLQYSKDELKIKTLMKQLMFRFNRQQYQNRNRKLKGKDKPSVNEKHQRDESETDPITTSNKRKNPFGSHPGIWPKYHSARKAGGSHTSNEKSTTDALTQAKSTTVGGSLSIPISDDSDEDERTSFQRENGSKQRHIKISNTPSKSLGNSTSKTTNVERTANFRASIQPEPSPKRIRTSRLESDDDDLYSPPEIDTTSPSTGPAARLSPRERRVRQMPDYVTGQQFNETIESLTSGKRLDDEPSKRQEQPHRKETDDSIDTPIDDFVTVHNFGVANLDNPPTFQKTAGTSSNLANAQNNRLRSPQTSPATPPQLNIPPTNLLTPISAEAHRNNGSPIDRTNLSKSPPPLNSSVNFIYHIIQSRLPILHTERWRPKGKLQDKTLDEVFIELRLDRNVYSLIFTLEGPGLRSKDQIDRDDEANFEYMKQYFNKQIEACISSCESGSKPPIFEVEIEPLRRVG